MNPDIRKAAEEVERWIASHQDKVSGTQTQIEALYLAGVIEALYLAGVAAGGRAMRERCALIVCPEPHIEEERRCQDIAAAIRALPLSGGEGK